MKEAQDTTKESIFIENMRSLTRFSYNPCCSGNDGVWMELQKTVSGFLASNKGWLLRAPCSNLISGEGQLAKDVLAVVTNNLAMSDQCLKDKDKIIVDTNRSLIEKNQLIASTHQSLAVKDRIIADTEKSLIEKNKLIDSTYQSLAVKDRIIADTKKSLIDKDKTIAKISNLCMQAQGKCRALKTQHAQWKPAQNEKTKNNNKRQALTI